ncbi:MAG: hypothetical protein ACFFDW_13950, partial [Candidatus Thorarchaeota archaeon]
MEDIVKQLEILQTSPNTPRFVDFQVLAKRNRELEGEKYQLNLALMKPDTREPICNAIIYPGEWYPTRSDKPKFSHYHSVLRYCFAGLSSEGKPAELLLQIMKAVWKPDKSDEKGTSTTGQLIILKFIISPDHNITGG